jgi:hypothetical protein
MLFDDRHGFTALQAVQSGSFFLYMRRRIQPAPGGGGDAEYSLRRAEEEATQAGACAGRRRRNDEGAVRTCRMPVAGFHLHVRDCVLLAGFPDRHVIGQWNVHFHIKQARIHGIFIAEKLNNRNSNGIFVAE